MTRKTVFWSLGMFLVGFCVLAAMLHVVVPSPLDLHADMRSEKLLLLQQWHGKATAAAFGSSHVNNGFDPRAFDATLAAAPIEEKTINLAVAGGAQTEQRSLALRFVHQLQPVAGDAPPLVLLELNAGANLTNDHLVHPRAINLYDPSTVRFAWALGGRRLSKSQTWGRRGYALAAAMLYEANFGMLSSKVFSAPMDDERVHAQSAEDRRGLDVEHIHTGPAPDTAKMIAAQKWTLKQEKGVLVPANRLLAEELQDFSAEPGLQVAYMVTPRIDNADVVPVWPACLMTKAGAVPILSLAEPQAYPELFRDPANWFDDAHLTEKGAAIASRILAEKWMAWKQHPSTACED